jgi:hypothetical protein
MNTTKPLLSPEQISTLLATVQERFAAHTNRHPNLTWEQVRSRLESNPEKLWFLFQMESTGGEPDVVGVDEKTGELIFFDCSPETPAGRRNTCYDRAALDARKANKPSADAMTMAAEMGIELLDEDRYLKLQTLGEFDLKTSSWIKTPTGVRKLGGALFGDRRYDRVFIFHNGADSYYGGRGFRGELKV